MLLHDKNKYTMINNILLNRNDGQPFASLNNSSSQQQELLPYDNNPKNDAGKRYNKFIITPEIANKLLAGSSSKFVITATCWNPTGVVHNTYGRNCHKGVGDIIITNGQGERFQYDASTPEKENETKTLLAMNACGSKK
jgi:hypothetical protein